MYNKTIIRDNIAYDILHRIPVSNFRGRDGNIDKRTLGLFVAEVGADKVMEVNRQLLICKTIEDAEYEEIL